MLQSLVAQLITFWEKEEVKRHFRSEIKASFDAQAEIQKSWTQASLGVPADNYTTQIV